MITEPRSKQRSSVCAAEDRKHRGLFVVIIGPDGSGKSTLLEKAQEQLASHFPAIRRFHWRARVLPRLHGASQNIRSEASQRPPKDFAYGRTLSALRFCYHYADFLLGYWLVIRPARARGHLIVVERWYLDTIVNPVRYGFHLPEWLLRIAGRFIPRPDLTVLLEAPVGEIHARKPELSVEELQAQFEKMRAILPGSGRRISTSGSIDRSAGELAAVVLDAAQHRTVSARDAGAQRRDEWRAFPRTRNVKLWIHARDPITNALHLYHPYSLIGRTAIRLMAYLPRGMTTGRLQQTDSLRLELFRGAIRRILGHDDLIVSFCTGTPNAHRKITAQVSRDGAIIAYVKIGSSDAAKKLMESEALALSRLDRSALSPGISVPRVLAQSTMDDNLLLALSAPSSPGKQRSSDLDEHDICFLSSLAPLQQRVETLARVLDTIGLGASEGYGKYPELIASAREVAKALFASGVRLGFAHGDYAPWNSLTLRDGSLYVFDWEHAAEAPLLNDLFHRVFMPDRLVNGSTPPSRAISRLLALADMPLTRPLLEKYGIGPADFPAYLLLYFLRLAVRETREKGDIDEYLRECFRLVLAL